MVNEDKEKQRFMQEAILYKRMQKDPFLFIKLMWNLVPQEKWEQFIKGRHISWQQAEMIQSLKDAINWVKSRKISIRSWRWVGKTSWLSWSTLWFLYCYENAIITCTGPSSKQLQDGIWKELSVWLNRMPEWVRNRFEKTNEYLRLLEKPNEWYARVVTGTKENAENVSWVHSDNIMTIIDEASWVADEITEAVKWTMTSKNAVLIMISNPTRLDWYFYKSHNQLSDSFQCLHFNGEESPNVDKQYIQEQLVEHGSDSDEYRFNVLWEFPKAEWADDWWRIPLLQLNDLHFTFDNEFKPFRMGIDPSWAGRDDSKFIARDSFKARVVWSEKISDPKSIASLSMTLWTQYDINWEQFYVDNFWVGANVAQELWLAGIRCNGVNVWDKARDSKRFKNIRAEAYRTLREWCKKWWELVNNRAWEDELLKIKYKRGLDGRIQIMPKAEMKKRMWKSPDTADALMLTFIDPDNLYEEDDVITYDYTDML